MFEGFDHATADLDGTTIAYVTGGGGKDNGSDSAPVLLLHGFPQTRAMWAAIAPILAEGRRVVAADLRGYGASSRPDGIEAMSFRAMAGDMVALMTHLGHDRFDVIGHDRGARTAHRMALDHPDRLRSLVLMDIAPTQELLDNLITPVARAYYHWFFLAQPAPFPETMIGRDPDHYFESCLAGWGAAGLSDFAPEQLDAYRATWRDPGVIHTMCNDYRAAIAVDLALDRADLDRQVSCPALVMYGADGIMGRIYDMAAIWSPRLARMQVCAMPGGHFFPDLHPARTAAALVAFLDGKPVPAAG